MSRRAKAYLVALLIAAAVVVWALARLLSPEPAATPATDDRHGTAGRNRTHHGHALLRLV